MLPFDLVIDMFPGAGHWRDTSGKKQWQRKSGLHVGQTLSGHILMDKVRYLSPSTGLMTE